MNINIRHIMALSVSEFDTRKNNYLYLYLHDPFVFGSSLDVTISTGQCFFCVEWLLL
jgi:hypothetical protein